VKVWSRQRLVEITIFNAYRQATGNRTIYGRFAPEHYALASRICTTRMAIYRACLQPVRSDDRGRLIENLPPQKHATASPTTGRLASWSATHGARRCWGFSACRAGARGDRNLWRYEVIFGVKTHSVSGCGWPWERRNRDVM